MLNSLSPFLTRPTFTMSICHVIGQWSYALPLRRSLSARGFVLLVALLSLKIRFATAHGAVHTTKQKHRDVVDSSVLKDILRASFDNGRIENSGFVARPSSIKSHDTIKGSADHSYGRESRSSAGQPSVGHAVEGLAILAEAPGGTRGDIDNNDDIDGDNEESSTNTESITVSGSGGNSKFPATVYPGESKLNKYSSRISTTSADNLAVSKNGENNVNIRTAASTSTFFIHNDTNNDIKNYKNVNKYRMGRTSLSRHSGVLSRIQRRHFAHEKTMRHSNLRKIRVRSQPIKFRFFMKKLWSGNSSSTSKLASGRLSSLFWEVPLDKVRSSENEKGSNLDIPFRNISFMQDIFSTSKKVGLSVDEIPVIDIDRKREEQLLSNASESTVLSSGSFDGIKSRMVAETSSSKSSAYLEHSQKNHEYIDMISKRHVRLKRHRKRLLSHVRRQQRSAATRHGRAETITYRTSTGNNREESVLYVQNLVVEGTGRGIKKVATPESEQHEEQDSVKRGESQNTEESITQVFRRLPAGATAKDRYVANQLESLANITRMMNARRKCITPKKSDAVRLMFSDEQVSPHFKREVAKVVEVANHINNLLMLSQGQQLSRAALLNQFFALAESVLEIGPRVLGCSIFYTIPANTSNSRSNTTSDKDNSINNDDKEDKDQTVKNVTEIGYIYPFVYYNESTIYDNADKDNNNNNNDKNRKNKISSQTIVLTDLSKEWDPRKMPFVKRHAERENAARLLLPTRVVLADQHASGDLNSGGNWSHMIRVSSADGAWEPPYYECLFSRMVIQYSVPFYRVDAAGVPVFQ